MLKAQQFRRALCQRISCTFGVESHEWRGASHFDALLIFCLPSTDTVTEHVSCFFVRSVFTMEAPATNRCLRLYFKRSSGLIQRASDHRSRFASPHGLIGLNSSTLDWPHLLRVLTPLAIDHSVLTPPVCFLLLHLVCSDQRVLRWRLDRPQSWMFILIICKSDWKREE